MQTDGFITPEKFEEIKRQLLSGPNGWLLFAACNEGIDLARAVKKEYDSLLVHGGSRLMQVPLLNDPEWGGPEDGSGRLIARAPDTETIPTLPFHVAGSNVYVFQSVHELRSGNTVNENFGQLKQMIRTLRVHGARTITAVTPYAPYSRQDKPTFMSREATLAKLVADELDCAGARGALVYHPHAEGIRGFYEPEMKFTALNGLDLFIELMGRFRGMKDVTCVSTDAGNAKFTLHFAKALNVGYAIANKYRSNPEKSEVLGIIGDLEGKRVAILGDDESVTFMSLLNAARDLHGEKYAVSDIYMLISHNKIRPEFVPQVREARDLHGLQEFHVTDSIPQRPELLELPFVTQHSLALRFARTINRLHYDQSVSELFYRPPRKK